MACQSGWPRRPLGARLRASGLGPPDDLSSGLEGLGRAPGGPSVDPGGSGRGRSEPGGHPRGEFGKFNRLRLNVLKIRVLVVGLLFLVAGCYEPPHGIVVRKEYKPSRVQHMPIMVGKMVIQQKYHIPEKWVLHLDSGQSVSVYEDTYNGIEVGEYW